MAKDKQTHPRLIEILSIFLILQAPLILFLGINLITQNWTFLLSWSVFFKDLQQAFLLLMRTPEFVEGDEILFYHLLAYFFLLIGALMALIAGVTFNRGRPFSWVMSLLAQITILLTGIGLYFFDRPSQSYWLMAVGILMVLYLNYGDVRQWFLKSGSVSEVGNHE